MRRPPPPRRLIAAVLAAGALLLSAAGPAVAELPRPTVDPAAPTPTVPYPGLPPQGSAPDGSTVGGAGLDTRGLVTVAGAPPLPAGIDAHGWLVADAGTGEVLAAQDPHGRYYPASTLKTLTLLTLTPVLDPSAVIAATVDDENMEGSRVGLVAGGQYPVSLLFQAMVLQSGNDCANALARAAGGVAATVAAMNATAARIGAWDTVAGTPSGLDVAGQSSSPYDLALIMRQLVADPTDLGYLQTRTAQLPDVPGHPGFQIQSQDTLLSSYPGTLGGKTGFTDAARHTFVAAVERNGRRLVVSIMQAERRPVPELDQATRLLDWGFSTAADAHGLGHLVDPGEVPAVAAPAAATASATPTPAPATPATTPAAAAHSDTAGDGTASDLPVLPAALAGGALLVVAGTLASRRRAVRPVAATAERTAVRRPSPRRPDVVAAEPAPGSPRHPPVHPPPPPH